MSGYTPAELLSEYDRLRSEVTPMQFYGTGGKRLREMWCAAKFARGLERMAPCRVFFDEVHEQDSIDFAVHFQGGRTQSFQLVEVQTEGRRRNDEYRDRAPGALWFEPFLESEQAVERIAGAIEAKAAKFYSDQADLQLLVYANLSAWDLDPAAIQQRCAAASASFAGVWVMTGELFACIYQTPIQIVDPKWMTFSA